LLNVDPRYSVHDLLAQLHSLDMELVRSALTSIAANFQLLAGPQEAIRHANASWSEVTHLVRYLKPLADVIVLHVPCTYDDLQFDALASCDDAVILAEQKVPAVRALQMVRQALQQKEAAGAQQLVINRYQSRLKGFSLPELENLLSARLRTITEDVGVTAAVNQGLLLRDYSPRSQILTDVAALIAPLLPAKQKLQAKPGHSGVFTRLVHAFGLC
jgi:Flp pilus assembly CpaE family ATPase